MYSRLLKTSYPLAKILLPQNVSRYISNSNRQCSTVNGFKLTINHQKNSLTKCNILVDYQQTRTHVSSFLNKYSADQIWKSVSSVSNAGKKRGRGKIKGKKVIRDLNRGQVIGVGAANVRWPGLSAPIIKGREMVQREQLPPDPKYMANLIKERDNIRKFKRLKVAPIDRGWTGGHPEGRRIGPPDPIGEYTFDGFDSQIIEQKVVSHMTGNFGRYRRVSAMVMTGNGKGLCGFGFGKALQARSAISHAKNRAGQKLMLVPLDDNHTVMHDFHACFGRTKVFVWRQNIGYGLVCHRVIKSCCELIGIKDLYAKVEGGKANHHIVKAFIIGLLRQKSFEDLAEETNLHVVEFNRETDNFPKLRASPKNPIEDAEETPDFGLHVFENKVYHWKRKLPKFFTKRRRWSIVVRKRENIRSHFDTRIQLLAHYGELKSFHTDEHPECRPYLPKWTRPWNRREPDTAEGSEPIVNK